MAKLENWDVYDWSKPSKAFVATDGYGNGIVIQANGPHLNHEIDEKAKHLLDDLGLLPPQPGVWVWEGTFVEKNTGEPYNRDGQNEPVGEFRKLNQFEWESLRADMSPWDEEEWRYQEPPTPIEDPPEPDTYNGIPINPEGYIDPNYDPEG